MSTRILRCAVYTRKSTEEGLDQAFNSLDAQREAGLNYIKSQKHQGWTAITTTYDDGGYSGGSTDRPGLQRLLTDIQSSRIDVVVVYKVDRLSRSLADFARLMQVFDEYNVSFVSVTQQFNTTSSMGRLTLNMLLSFAQFEREVTGERIRDKILATKRKGVWISGQPPLGYRRPTGDEERDHRLHILEPEAELVRAIYAGYLELGSLVELADKLNAQGHTTRRWKSTLQQRWHGGKPLTTTYLYRVLTNPVYIGKITHTRNGITDVWPGLHQPIIDQATWDRVQETMTVVNRQTLHRWTHTHLLKGKLRTLEDHAMTPGSVQRPVSKLTGRGGPKRTVCYYVSIKAIKHGYKSCPIKTINGEHIDNLTRALVTDHLRTAHKLDLRPLDQPTRDYWIREIIHRVVLAPDSLSVELNDEKIESIRNICAETRPAASSADGLLPACHFKPEVNQRGPFTVLKIHLLIKKLDGRRVLLSPEGHDLLLTLDTMGQPVPQPHLVRAVGQAFAWHRELLRTGDTTKSMAKSRGLSPTRVQLLLRLTQLSPTILKAILTGHISSRIGVNDLLAAACHLDWSRQAQMLGMDAQPVA